MTSKMLDGINISLKIAEEKIKKWRKVNKNHKPEEKKILKNKNKKNQNLNYL